MATYKHRDITSTVFLGERIDFVAANDRIRERVENLSHEKSVLEKLVEDSQPDDVFWDIGACLGIHSFVLAKHLSDGMVYSFEPMHTNRAVCVDNKSVNELDNVYISRAALSDETGKATFEIRESMEAGFGRHSLQSDEGDYDFIRTIQVPTKTGDTLDFQQPNIVKIDVEGASPLVLEGMEEVLSDPACRTVILETHEPNPVQPSHEDFGAKREDIIETLESYGFNVDTLENDFHLYATRNTDEINLLEDATINVELRQGDISESDTDVIINSAGTSLRMGTGVAGSLKRAAGPELQQRAIEKGPIEVGEAAVTKAYELDSEYVIHAASMPHYGDGKSTKATIREATLASLKKAEALGAESLAIPAIGCGLGGVSLSTGAKEILETISDYESNTIKNIEFVLYSKEEYETVSNLV